MYDISIQVFPTEPSPTTTHLMSRSVFAIPPHNCLLLTNTQRERERKGKTHNNTLLTIDNLGGTNYTIRLEYIQLRQMVRSSTCTT